MGEGKRTPNNSWGLTLLVDSREKTPFDLVDGSKIIASERIKLDTGDYAIKDIDEKWLCIERKSGISELYACLTSQRKRFEKEIERMREFHHKFIVIEADAEDVNNLEEYFWIKSSDNRKQWAIRQTASKIIRSSLINWSILDNIHFLFIGKNRTLSKHWMYSIIDRAYIDWQRTQDLGR